MLKRGKLFLSFVSVLLLVFSLASCDSRTASSPTASSPLDTRAGFFFDRQQHSANWDRILQSVNPDVKKVLSDYDYGVRTYVERVKERADVRAHGRDAAQKHANELENLQKMTYRELYRHFLALQEKTYLAGLNILENQTVSITGIEYESAPDDAYYIMGTVRNDSSFDYSGPTGAILEIEMEDGRVVTPRSISPGDGLIKKGEVIKFKRRLDSNHPGELLASELARGKKLEARLELSTFSFRGADGVEQNVHGADQHRRILQDIQAALKVLG